MDRRCSTPDYQWPIRFMGWKYAPVRWIGALVFHAAWIVGRIVHRAMVPAKAVLVIRTDGLGDGILFEPALRSLSERFPEHEIHLWGSPAICDLYAAAPYITDIVMTPRGGKEGNLRYFTSPFWRARLGYALARHHYDVAIYPAESPEPLGNWLLTSARATERWVTNGDLENQFDVQRRATIARATRVLSPRSERGHELVRNAHLARQWDVEIDGDWPQIHMSDRSIQVAFGRIRYWRSEQARLNAVGIVGVCPAGSMAVNTYPPGSWVEIVKALWSEHRLLPAFLGGRTEEKVIDEIAEQLPETPYLRIGQPLDVLALASLIGRLDAMISVDTGPAHIALAQKVPTVVLCGGGHPGRFFPWPNAQAAIVLNQPMPCDGCLCRCSLSEPECITRIRPNDVIRACVALTERKTRLRVAV